MRKPTAEQVAKMRPKDGWADVKFVITAACMHDPGDGREPWCRFQPPGKPLGSDGWTAGDIFSMDEDSLEGCPVEQWLTTGRVILYKEPPAKKAPKEKVIDG